MEPVEDATPVDVDEVLPPESDTTNSRQHEGSASRSASAFLQQSFPAFIARVLDDCLTIPKSRIRIGLDPILGFFFPAIGDAVSATLGATILLEALRRRLPRPIVVRMGLNIALNAGVGTIPILGDLFSIWYKSNAQNLALLEKHSGNPDQPEVRPNLLPLLLFLLGIFGLIALMLTLVVIVFRAVFL